MARSDLPSHRINPLRGRKIESLPLEQVIVDEVAPTWSDETDSIESPPLEEVIVDEVAPTSSDKTDSIESPSLEPVIVDEVDPTSSDETDSIENGEIRAFDGIESDVFKLKLEADRAYNLFYEAEAKLVARRKEIGSIENGQIGAFDGIKSDVSQLELEAARAYKIYSEAAAKLIARWKETGSIKNGQIGAFDGIESDVSQLKLEAGIAYKIYSEAEAKLVAWLKETGSIENGQLGAFRFCTFDEIESDASQLNLEVDGTCKKLGWWYKWVPGPVRAWGKWVAGGSQETYSIENGEIGAFDGICKKFDVAATWEKFWIAGDVDDAEGTPQQSWPRWAMGVAKDVLTSLGADVVALPYDDWLSGKAFMQFGAPVSLLASKGVDWAFDIGVEDVDAKVGHTYRLAFESRSAVLLLYGFGQILKYSFQKAGWQKGCAFMKPIVISFSGCAAYNLHLVVHTYLTLAGEHYYGGLTK